jgi:integrase
MGDRLYKKKGGNVWYGSFYGPDGKRHIICTKQQDRNAARAVLRDAEREAHGAPGSPKAKGETGHTVNDALQYLLDFGCADVSPATAIMHQQKAGHLTRILGEIDVGKLRIEDVQKYIAQRIGDEEGAHRESVRKELCTLRRALQISQDRKILHVDPRTLIPKMRVRYVPRDRYLSQAELDLLLAELEPHRQLWVLLAVYTGGRASELASIRWEHVDLENCRLLLPGTKTQKSRRWVPIAASLLTLLQDIPPELRVGPIAEKWENVRRSLKLAVDRINARREAEATKAGRKTFERMRHVSPNDLRRTFASWLKQHGVDSMVVAKLLGHTSSRMVELVYGHLNDATHQAAIRLLPQAKHAPLDGPPTEPEPAAPEAGKVIELHAWRAHGREPTVENGLAEEIDQAPKAGSKWVAKPVRNLRRERPERGPQPQSSSQVAVPRVGIEPTTRGFSVRCSTN